MRRWAAITLSLLLITSTLPAADNASSSQPQAADNHPRRYKMKDLKDYPTRSGEKRRRWFGWLENVAALTATILLATGRWSGSIDVNNDGSQISIRSNK